MYQYPSILKNILLVLALWLPLCLWAQPTVDLGADTILCGPATFTLDAGNAGATFLWNTGDQTQTLLVDSSAIYIVTVTDGTGSASDTVYVGFAPDPQTPDLADTTFCGEGLYQLVAQNNGGTIFWYDSSGQEILAVGDTFETFLDQGTSFKAEARGVVDTSIAGFTNVTGAYFAILNDRGMVFDVKIPVLLGTVDIAHQGTQTADLELYDPSGTLMYSKALQLTNGLNTIPIYTELEAGSGYTLLLANLGGGGSLNVRLPITFPLDYETLTFTGGTPVANHYNYFYNWELFIGGSCKSDQDSMAVSLNTNPIVDIGIDTVLCGASTYPLDAGNPGSQYDWNTSETAQAISANGTGFYSVNVTNAAGCVGSDTAYVGFASDPVTPLGSDTSFCGPGEYTLTATSLGGTIFWYDSSGQEILGVGDTLLQEINQTTQFQLEARGVVDTATAGFGGPAGSYFAITNDRGVLFDVKVPLLLGTIDVAHQNQQTADVELYAPDNSLIYSISVLLVDGINEIPIFVNLDPGEGYRLMLSNLGGGGSLNVRLPFIFPLDYASIRLTSGTPIANHYNYFYNWKTYIGGLCASDRDTLIATIASPPTVALGVDTVFCSVDSFTLDALNPGSTFLWSDGSDGQTLTVDSTTFYSVDVLSPNGCEASDTVFIGFAETPQDPVVADTSFCGPGTVQLVAQNNGGKIFWYDATATSILGIGDTLEADLTDDAEYLVLAQGVVPAEGAGRITVPTSFFGITNDRGLVFNTKAPIVLEQVKTEIQGQLSATVTLYDAQGTLMDSRPVEFTDGTNIVFLGFSIPPGTGYRLMLEGLSGGGFTPVNITNTYPLVYSLVDIVEGFPIVEHYNYFYDWKISIGGGCASAFDSMKVDIALPLELPDSIYSCGPVNLDATLPNANYLWSTNETTGLIEVSETGMYLVTVDDGAACLLQDSVFVEIPQDAGLPADGVLCGTTLSTNYGPDATFEWSTGDSTETIELTAPGTYSVTVYEPRGCVLTDTVVITAFAAFPEVELGADLSACDSVVLGQNNDPNLSYVWSTGETTPQITVFSSGTYSVAGSNANGCVDADTLGVLITPVPTADFFFVVSNFTVNFINLSTFATPQWTFGDGNTSTAWAPSYTYQDTGTYTVQLIVSNICGSDTLTQIIKIESTVGIQPEANLPRLELSPNPATDQVRISMQGMRSTQAQMDLLDAQGRQLQRYILSQSALEAGYMLSVQALPPGLYYLRLQTENRQTARTLLVR